MALGRLKEGAKHSDGVWEQFAHNFEILFVLHFCWFMLNYTDVYRMYIDFYSFILIYITCGTHGPGGRVVRQAGGRAVRGTLYSNPKRTTGSQYNV